MYICQSYTSLIVTNINKCVLTFTFFLGWCGAVYLQFQHLGRRNRIELLITLIYKAKLQISLSYIRPWIKRKIQWVGVGLLRAKAFVAQV